MSGTANNAFPLPRLSGNTLKCIAALSMLLDHAGVLLFPEMNIFRILGRLAFPVFAFMIAEGCHYTRSRLRYFLSVFLLGAVCQVVYYLFEHSLYMNILLTFSVSILLIYAVQNALAAAHRKASALPLLVIIPAVFAVYLLNRYVTLDYGFFGCLAPAFPALLRLPRTEADSAGSAIPAAQRFLLAADRLPVRVLLLGIGLIPLIFTLDLPQPWSFCALPLLMLYSGKRGNRNMKWFFYIFYPLHLALLEGIALLIA